MLGEIIIFPDAKGNGYTNNIVYTHSSDLLTNAGDLEIFNVGPCLLSACIANDLSDLFEPGPIPNQITTNHVPEPGSALLVVGGLFGVALTRRSRKFVSR